jgi:hypothetical protein
MFRGIRYVIPNVACHLSRREVKEGSLEGNVDQTPRLLVLVASLALAVALLFAALAVFAAEARAGSFGSEPPMRS